MVTGVHRPSGPESSIDGNLLAEDGGEAPGRNRATPWPWIPVALAAVVLVGLSFTPGEPLHTPRPLLPVLNGIFSTFVALLIALLAARSYRAGGPSVMLLLGCGMMAFCAASVLTSIFMPLGQENTAVTVYNLGVCLAGLANLLGALRITLPLHFRLPLSRGAHLATAYGGILALMALITWTADAGILPRFILPDHATTLLRLVVLTVAIGTFAAAASLLLAQGRRHGSAFLRWYAMGLLLLAIGLTGVMFQRRIDGPLNWGGRAVQYLGGIYLLVAVGYAVRQSRRWMITLEEALRHAEERFQAISEVAFDAVVIHMAGTILESNEACQRIFGYSRVMMTGKSLFSLAAPESQEAIREHIAAGSEEPYEVTAARRDGTTFIAEMRGKNITYRGRPARASVLRDITRQKQAMAALAWSEERARLATEAGEMATWDWHVGSGEVVWNDLHFRMLGYEPGSVKPSYEAWTARLHPEDRARTEALLQKSMNGGTDYRAKFRIVRPDGSIHWIEARGRCEQDSTGRPRRNYGVMFDVSDRERMEEQLKRAKEAAEAASKAKDQFLAVLSHELRTPLAPAAMSVAAMEQDSRLPEPIRQELAMVRRNIDLEVRIIDDLLDISRAINGRLRLHPETVSLQELVRQALTICEGDIQARHIRVTCELSAEYDMVHADPGRLQQVFWNLIKNAVKFTPEGGWMKLRCATIAQEHVQVQVQDSGVGIPAGSLERIFDAFEQADANIGRQFGGLGLGLAISKAIVDLHGGAIRAESPGLRQGSTFTVELPLAKTNHTQRRQALPMTRTASVPVESLRLLLVEDHADTATILSRLLTLNGHVVTVAETLQNALRVLAAGEKFDVLLSDLSLPDGTGYDLLAEVRKRYPDLPAICMSGFGMESDVARSRAAGFAAHLIKPIRVAQLEETIERVMAEGPASA